MTRFHLLAPMEALSVYTKYQYRVPFIVTANPSTSNLEYLQSHPWLGLPVNRYVLELTEDAFEEAPAEAVV